LADAIDPQMKYGGGDPDFRALLSGMSERIVKLEDLESQPASVEQAQELAQAKQLLREIVERVRRVRKGK
jgi:hypothetical protein